MNDALLDETKERHDNKLLHFRLQFVVEWVSPTTVFYESKDCGELQVNGHRLCKIAKLEVLD